ncbi:hypothetical protein Cni_G27322 [Canna indica]|uniref:Late embryogenesis abundant protein LEA-2 subgroup domain-containing protein n=1 Tax=Canna indica TaxID=4628 RepID=A0AAQ3QS35_9LILI|nr:hypothetical protein Cni_G27322 [Canna indica]
MAERAPPTDTAVAYPPAIPVAPADSPPPAADPTPSTEPHFGTYVVQVPKEQVYRVPPPENARLVEEYRNRKNDQRCSPCLRCCKWLLITAFVVLVVLVLIAVVFYVSARPGVPAFTVEHLAVRNHSKAAAKGLERPKLDYDFMLSVENPSRRMGYSYEAGGQAAVVVGEGARIAAGTTPALRQGSRNTTSFRLVVRGLNTLLPKEIERSMKGSKDAVALELRVETTARPRAGGMELWAMSVKVACGVRVRDLGKDEARILSQDCSTKLRL